MLVFCSGKLIVQYFLELGSNVPSQKKNLDEEGGGLLNRCTHSCKRISLKNWTYTGYIQILLDARFVFIEYFEMRLYSHLFLVHNSPFSTEQRLRALASLSAADPLLYNCRLWRRGNGVMGGGGGNILGNGGEGEGLGGPCTGGGEGPRSDRRNR
jgi:hypothetical protein